MNGRKLVNRIGREIASQKLKSGNIIRKRKADRIELFWMDYFLFEVQVNPKLSEVKSDWVLSDIEAEIFLFFRQDEYDSQKFIIEKDLSEKLAKAAELVRREYSYHLLQRNLQTKLNAEVESIECREVIRYPFWLGYFIHSNHYTLEILDGINGKIQGGKLKAAISQSLLREYDSRSESIMPSLPRDIARSSDK